MKPRNLKTIFAAAAITVGMVLSADEAQAQYPAQSPMNPDHPSNPFSPINPLEPDNRGIPAYEWEAMQRAEERVKTLDALQEVIADPNNGPDEIKAALGQVKFDHFDKGDAKHIYDAREAVLGDAFKEATESQAIEIMHTMHEMDDQENSTRRTAWAFIALLGGAGYALGRYQGRRQKTTLKP